MDQSPLQTNNTQSGQFSNLQPTTQFQSKSTQPVALNPNQLDSETTLIVVGPPSPTTSQASATPGDAVWPFVVLAFLAATSILGFVFYIARTMKSPPEVEEQPLPQPVRKPSRKKSRKKRRQK